MVGQNKSLETFKLINAASTALRLYPEESPQVLNSVEQAYQGTKSFLRKNSLLRFSFVAEKYMLNGEPVDNLTRERLSLLTFCEQLQKIGLSELVLSKGYDRKTFKKILSVLSATMEQINSAGGSRAFVEQLGLDDIFPKQYQAAGESTKEKIQKQKNDRIFKKLSGGLVRSEHILYLAGRAKNKKNKQILLKSLQSSRKSGHVVAATTFSLLQTLNKEHAIAVSPIFYTVLETVSTHLEEDRHQTVSDNAATLLAPHLDESTVLILICQEYNTPFGEFFYDSLLTAIPIDTLENVLAWAHKQQNKEKSSDNTVKKQLHIITQGIKKFLKTSRGKLLLARDMTKETLHKTEQKRKEKRVQAGMTALINGNTEVLDNEELCLNVPSTIEKLLENGKESVAASIIQNIVSGLQDKKYTSPSRERLAGIVGSVACKLAHIDRWIWLEKLTPICLAWIRETENADTYLEQHIRSMQAMMNQAWYADNIDLAENILNVFYYIRSGAMDKTDAVREMVGRIQDDNVDLVLLQGYLERCFVKPVDEMICRKIVMQGPVAARFLLDTLITSDNRAHRIRLLKILAEMGTDLVPVLLERLPDPMPWFGKRNIIRLLAATGTAKDVDAVLGYINHEDLRVQQEVLQCISRIGQHSAEHIFTQILPRINVQLSIQAVKNLRRIATEDVVVPLAKLLKESKIYSQADKLLMTLEISKTLGASGASKALPVLQKIIAGGEKQYDKNIIETAKLAFSFIKEQKKSRRIKQASHPYNLLTAYPEEREVYDLLQKDKRKAAIKVLSGLIEKTALFRRVDDAEQLRLRLIDIDPLALPEIIATGDHIEEAKNDSIGVNHVLIWTELYEIFSVEDFNIFSKALENVNYPTETTIVKQGDPQWQIYFINKGRVKLFYNDKECNTLVKTLGPGEMFGETALLDDSFWTLNITAMKAVEVSILSMESVLHWQKIHPVLETTLREYCQQREKDNEFFRVSGAERRDSKRFTCPAAVYIVLLNEKGEPTDTTMHGTCVDVSTGGISFLSEITHRRQAHALLGRRIEISLTSDDTDVPMPQIHRHAGVVVAIKPARDAGRGRSVHIHFDIELDPEQFSGITHAN